MTGRRHFLYVIPLVVSSVVLLIFSSGFSGPFLLDDMSSLPTLYGNISGNGFWFGVFEGKTGPLGRPLALITFALQQANWPNPYYFKFVNVIIHCASSILIFILTYKIASLLPLISERKKRILFAVVVTLLWACSPIQVSSVLYVVQRMTTLSSFFVLCGLCSYIYYRVDLVKNDRCWFNLLMMSLSISIFGLLAIFSKESGFLIVFYMLALEVLMPSLTRKPVVKKYFRCWKVVFLYFPIVLFFIYACFTLLTVFLEQYGAGREFSLLERLMTESRVIVVYLRQIILPQVSSLGVFHDDFIISKGFFSPVSTGVAIIAIGAALIVAFLLIKRQFIISFVIFWFFAGHIMESTIFPLELYFEHRNYLALYSVMFALVYVVFAVVERYKSIKYPMFGFLVVLIGGYLFLTVTQVQSWGSELEFAFQQAKYHPKSIRARALKVEMLAKYSEINPDMRDLAYKETKKIQKEFSDRISTSLFDIEFACAYGDEYHILPLDYIKDRITTGLFEPAVIKMMSDLTINLSKNQCKSKEITTDYAREIIRALIESDRYVSKRSSLYMYLASLYYYEENMVMSINSLLEAENKTYDIRMQLARLLATTLNYQEALRQLDEAEKNLSIDFNSAHRIKSLRRLREVIEQDLKKGVTDG